MNKFIEKAKEALENHGLVVFPTETVMGIGVIFDDELAFHKLNEVKRRPENKPYTLMLSDTSKISVYGHINDRIQRIIDHFMPGSLTILLKKKEGLPSYVAPGDTVGIRVPTNKEALDLLNALDKPILAPSANRAGEQPTYSSEEAKAIFGDEIDVYIPGSSKKELPSTIVDLSGEQPVLIRKGPIPFEDIVNEWNK